MYRIRNEEEIMTEIKTGKTGKTAGERILIGKRVLTKDITLLQVHLLLNVQHLKIQKLDIRLIK